MAVILTEVRSLNERLGSVTVPAVLMSEYLALRKFVIAETPRFLAAGPWYSAEERDERIADSCTRSPLGAGGQPPRPVGTGGGLSPLDGPEGGCWVWWRGKRHDVPKGVVYRMIEYMWSRDYATYDDLERDVFDGPIECQTIRSTCSKAKKVLEKLGVPWRLAADSASRHVRKKTTTVGVSE
jgi:hypothetical protein